MPLLLHSNTLCCKSFIKAFVCPPDGGGSSPPVCKGHPKVDSGLFPEQSSRLDPGARWMGMLDLYSFPLLSLWSGKYKGHSCIAKSMLDLKR